jgi:hypothetical protein
MRPFRFAPMLPQAASKRKPHGIEVAGSSKKAHTLIAGGIATLILSTIIIGCGTHLKSKAGQ